MTKVLKNYVILLGGNIGEVKFTFSKIKNAFRYSEIQIQKESSIYRTQAWGMNGDDFLNQALEISSYKDAHDLLEYLLGLERDFGRFRSSSDRYESRTIDIDIIHAFDQIYDSHNLTIPHPRMHVRKFVLVPVSEITPDWIHPSFKKTCVELLRECDDVAYIEKCP